MAKSAIIVLAALFCAVSVAAVAKHFWRGEVMATEKVGEIWGKQPFDVSKFKTGTEADRAKMAYSLLQKQKEFAGKDATEIRQALGDYDGFYFRDTFPAYMIQSRTKESDSAWQIVFLLNNSFKVSEIVVHKNCCD